MSEQFFNLIDRSSLLNQPSSIRVAKAVEVEFRVEDCFQDVSLELVREKALLNVNTYSLTQGYALPHRTSNAGSISVLPLTP